MATNAEKGTRLLEAAAAVLTGASGNRLNIVVLNKALFYLDLYALRDKGETITQAAFIAIQLGPVVAHYEKRLVRALIKAGIAEQGADGLSKPMVLRRPPDPYHYLDERDRVLARKLGRKFSNVSSTQASEDSHRNPGWQLAYRPTGQKQPINMLIALQELADDDDAWLTAPPDEELQNVFAKADKPGKRW